MSIQSAPDRIKRQAKIFSQWGPWNVKLSVARDLISMAWGFDGWGEVVAVSKSASAPNDPRLFQIAQPTLEDPDQLIQSLCALSGLIQEQNLFAPRLYPAGAKMIVNAFYGIQKPHPVLAQTDVGDWILQRPAIWNRHEEPLQAAFDTRNDEHIGNVCRAILEEVPNHLDALTQLAYLALEEGNPEHACHWSTQAYEACQQAMVDGFDPLAEEVSWGFINNRPFHRALYAHAKVLCELGKTTQAKKLLKSLLFMNPRDSMGVCHHELISQNGVLGIFRPKTTRCSGGPAICGLQRGITFFEIPILALFE